MAARFLTVVAAALLLTSPNLWAQSQTGGDPPGRVGRLSAIEGTVQQRTPDDNDWVQANINYPVTTGFAIAPQDGGRAEIEVGSMALRVGPVSELDVTTLTERETSLTLAQGELNLRVGQLPRSERIEVTTPRGVMEILAAGQYHLDAGTTESPTRFEVFSGRAEVQRDGGNTALANGQAALINPDNTVTTASVEPDALDQWAFDRDRGPAPRTNTASAPPPPQGTATAPYVSPEMTGGAELSAYGSWDASPDYGQVWYPSGVAADWAPYTDGHWGWVSPWGWTWIDEEPWGFAPFHYGRWAYIDNRWGWVPGEIVVAPVYAPALVVFVGGGDHPFRWDRGREGIGWFPLGPHEPYQPGFRTSERFIREVNRTNVDVRTLNITRVNDRFVINNTRNESVSNFANHRFVTAVPTDRFGQRQRVRDVAVRNASVATAAASLPVSHTPPVTPPRTAATVNPGTARSAQFNGTRPPVVPQGRTGAGFQSRQAGAGPAANAPTHTVAGHTLPALPQAHGGATGSGAPGRFGANPRTPTTASGHNLPPIPSGRGGTPNIQTQHGTATGPDLSRRAGRGPFGSPRQITPVNPATSGSTGRGVTPERNTREFTPQSHTAQPSTTPAASGHRGFVAPSPPSVQRNTAAPTRSFTPPPHPQTPATTAAPGRSFMPPSHPQTPATTVAPGRSFTPPSHPQTPTTVAPAHNFSPPSRPQVSAPTRSFTPPPRPQVTAPAHTFSPPPRPQVSAPVHNVTPPTPHVAAPVHSAPPAAPAHPMGNAAVTHAPAPAPHAQPAPHVTPKDQKRNPNG